MCSYCRQDESCDQLKGNSTAMNGWQTTLAKQAMDKVTRDKARWKLTKNSMSSMVHNRLPRESQKRKRQQGLPIGTDEAKRQQEVTLGEGSLTIKGDKQNIWSIALQSACGWTVIATIKTKGWPIIKKGGTN